MSIETIPPFSPYTVQADLDPDDFYAAARIDLGNPVDGLKFNTDVRARAVTQEGVVLDFGIVELRRRGAWYREIVLTDANQRIDNRRVKDNHLFTVAHDENESPLIARDHELQLAYRSRTLANTSFVVMELTSNIPRDQFFSASRES